MHGRAAHRLAAVLAAHHQRVGALRDAVVGPVELVLLAFVGGEILERAKVRAGVEADDREALLGQARDQRAAAGAGADHDEVDLVGVGELPHRNPAAGPEHVGRAAARWRAALQEDQRTRLFSRARFVLARLGVASTGSQGSRRLRPVRT